MKSRPNFVGYWDYTEAEKMPDVVVSLRKVTTDGWDSEYLLSLLCQCAADEIERLRATLAEIALETSDYPTGMASDALGNPPTSVLWDIVKAYKDKT